MKKASIYLPIEIKARELNSFILLAKFAINRGFRVYLGSKSSIKRLIENKKFCGGAFIFKGGMPLADILKIRKRVNKFLILDQEISPSCLDFKKEIRRRVWPGSEKFIDRYYVIGDVAYNASLDVLKNLSPNIIKTGWPSIDLFRDDLRFFYNNKVNEIKKKYGDFILFSSAFGFNSQKMIDDFYQVKKDSNWESVRSDLNEVLDWAKLTLEEFQINIDTLKKIDQDKTCPQIIIRPHPAEDHNEWKKISKSFSKIKVIYEGSIIPWIYSAKGLLHRGCASSIQAYMAGIPTAYLILKKDCIKKALPYEISEHLYNFKDTVKFCKKNINITPVYKKNFSRKFHSMIYFRKDKYASEIIIDDLLNLNLDREESYKSSIRDKVYDIFNNLRKYFKKKITHFFKLKINIGHATESQKMPDGINKIEIDKLMNIIEPKKKFIVKGIFKDCVEIS